MTESILKDILTEIKSFKDRLDILEATHKHNDNNMNDNIHSMGQDSWEGRSRVFHRGSFHRGTNHKFRNRPLQYNRPRHERGAHNNIRINPPRPDNKIVGGEGPSDPSTTLSTLLFRSCQLKHHLANWQNLPTNLDKKFDFLFKNIVPPMPTDRLKNELNALNNDCKSKLVSLVLEHIYACQAETNRQLSLLQNVDFDEAGVKARAQLLQHYKSKMTVYGINTWLREDLRIVEGGEIRDAASASAILRGNGTDGVWNTVKLTGKRQASSPPLSTFVSDNRFNALSVEDPNSDMVGFAEGDFPPLSHTPKSCKKAKRKIHTDSLSSIMAPQASFESGGIVPSTQDLLIGLLSPDVNRHSPKQVDTILETSDNCLPLEVNVLVRKNGELSGNTSPLVGENLGNILGGEDISANPLTTLNDSSSNRPLISKTNLSNNLNVDKTASQNKGGPLPPTTAPLQVDHIIVDSDSADSPIRDLASNCLGLAPGGGSSLSQPNPRSTGRVTLHQNVPKNAWDITLRRDTSTLLLGDSNLKLLRDLPPDWEAHVFPGCDLNNAALLISKLHTNKELRHIITLVGINNRSGPLNNIKNDVSKLFNAFSKIKGVQGHFLGVGIPDSIQGGERLNLENLNKLGAAKFSIHYIEPLKSKDISIFMGDKFRIHYDQITVDRTLNLIKNHFLGGGPLTQTPPSLKRNF